MNLSLTSGFLPIAVQVVVGLVLLVAIGRRSRTWYARWIPAAVLVGLAAAGAAYWYAQDEAVAEGSGPPVLWIWTALTGLGIVVAAAGWRGSRWWRRVTSLIAVPLCVLCAALAVNAWTGYLPTVASVWNRATDASLPTQIDEATARDMQRRNEIPQRGVMVAITTPDEASGFRHREELVYLPPAWFAPNAPALPAVLMVGGEFGHPDDWPTTGGAQRTADDVAAAHGGNAPILVFVDMTGQFINDTECVNGVRGNAADHLTKDVVPFVISHFGVSKEPANWGIVGWSSGGTCALTMTVMHPDMFSAFVDIDGELGPTAGSKKQTIARLFGGDAAAFDAFDPATVMAAHGPYSGIAGWFAYAGVGPPTAPDPAANPPNGKGSAITDPEDHSAVATDLCSLASSHGIECAVVPEAGGHDFATAARVFTTALPWLAGRIGTPGFPAIPLPGPPTGP